MYINELIIEFSKERNIKNSTMKGYVSALNSYTSFHNMSLNELINEAIYDENKNLIVKNRRIKNRLLEYRQYLVENKFSAYTIKTYCSRVKSFYLHYEIELPYLPNMKYKKEYETSYNDLPTKEDIKNALKNVSLDFKALILFMSSSGTAKAETLSLTINDFINATKEYHSNNTLNEILSELEVKSNIVPTFYLKRIKTEKYYYTFCSTEATTTIISYLKTRDNLELSDKLFPFNDSYVIKKFQEINDKNNWGFKGKYRFFRTHTLRKFHASNIGLPIEYIDALQGRSKNEIHETYIKTNPQKLKERYIHVMNNIEIYETLNNKKKDVSQNNKEEINITINIFVSDTQMNLY